MPLQQDGFVAQPYFATPFHQHPNRGSDVDCLPAELDCSQALPSDPAFCAFQQDGTVAQTKIKLRHGDTLVINTLVGTVQLNALRRFLAEGFQIHLQQNPLLHQIFAFEPREERAERLTPLEKKMYRYGHTYICEAFSSLLRQICTVPLAKCCSEPKKCTATWCLCNQNSFQRVC